MADTNDTSVFRRSALASGLVNAEQLAQADAALAQRGSGAIGAAAATEELIALLIAQRVLNKWQAEQLRLGRAKFSLGPYLMIDAIGQGGMGQVFQAEHTVMGRLVAVKVLPRSRSTPEAIASFHREIRAQAQLDHLNLVRALDAGHDGNVHYLVTEYVPGADLRKLVRRRGRLSAPLAAHLIAQAAQGLEHAHSKGMIHRDVKPGNLLVTPSAQVKVSDLGLVGYFDEHASGLIASESGKIVGTADYLAPEQVLTPNRVTPACDIYSLGCTLYYAVTGKVPFPGGSTRDKARAHCQLQPIDPRRMNPELSGEFVELLAAMMAKDVAARVASAAEVARLLEPWAAEGASLGPAELQALALSDSAPISAPLASLKPYAPQLVDQTPSAGPPPFLVQPDAESLPDDPSQVSQTTPAAAAVAEETMPILVRASDDPRPPKRGLVDALGRYGLGRLVARVPRPGRGVLPWWVTVLIVVASAAATLALGNVILRLAR